MSGNLLTQHGNFAPVPVSQWVAVCSFFECKFRDSFEECFVAQSVCDMVSKVFDSGILIQIVFETILIELIFTSIFQSEKIGCFRFHTSDVGGGLAIIFN